MKKICAMTSSIFCFDKPAQSIKALRTVGIDGVMFDFSVFCSAQGLLNLREKIEGAERTGGEKPKWKPEKIEEYYQKVTEAFSAHDFLPSVARLPFTDAWFHPENPGKYGELIELTLRLGKDCIAAAEDLGCTQIIVQPLFAGVERGREWEANREFYLELASACRKKDTRLLLANQCRDYNGHLVRGVCSDGAEAAAWTDALNREAAGLSGPPNTGTGEESPGAGRTDAGTGKGDAGTGKREVARAGEGTERFGFCLDVGNCNLCGQNIQEMIRALGNRLQAVILSENDGKNMARLLPFTNARGRRPPLDWLGVIRGLRDVSFDGCLILETTDTTVAFSPLLQPVLVPVYKAVLDYFEMQIAIERDLKKYGRIALFGAGNMCRNYMKCYGEKYPPLFTCDNNPELWGTEFEGLEVRNPEALKDLPENSGVIICNIFYREIEEQLRAMGIGNIGYFNDEYMPSFYTGRLRRETGTAEGKTEAPTEERPGEPAEALMEEWPEEPAEAPMEERTGKPAEASAGGQTEKGKGRQPC